MGVLAPGGRAEWAPSGGVVLLYRGAKGLPKKWYGKGSRIKSCKFFRPQFPRLLLFFGTNSPLAFFGAKRGKKYLDPKFWGVGGSGPPSPLGPKEASAREWC